MHMCALSAWLLLPSARSVVSPPSFRWEIHGGDCITSRRLERRGFRADERGPFFALGGGFHLVAAEDAEILVGENTMLDRGLQGFLS